MKLHSKVYQIITLATFILTGCSSSEQPDAMVHAAVEAANGKPQALWASLPASYQNDVKGLVTALAEKLDPKVWDEAFLLAQKATKVAQDKKDFILQMPQLQMVKIDPDGYDAMVKILTTLANSEVKTVAGLKAIDIENFLSGTISGLMSDLIKASKAAAKAKKATGVVSNLDKFKSAKTTVVSVDGDKAVVKIEIEGEKPTEEEFVKVEGKWIPKKLADSWAASIERAKASIAKIKFEPQMITMFQQMKTKIEEVLDKLAATKTKDEFNAALTQAMQAMPGLGVHRATPIPAKGPDGAMQPGAFPPGSKEAKMMKKMMKKAPKVKGKKGKKGKKKKVKATP
ncbi:MAG: hypothetical protein JW841_12215 [Deltaproteobacteria bacterium]|nr:hypothetical protein [Deltaproteobacteria bacterium]